MLLSDLKEVSKGRLVTQDSPVFKEEEHPRDNDGKFGEGAGHAKESKTASSKKSAPQKDYSAPEHREAISSIFKDVPGGVKMDVKKSGIQAGQCFITAKGTGVKFSGTIENKSSDFFVDEVHISKTHQGKGVGKDLVKNIVTFSQKEGLSTISLWAAEKAGIYAWAKLGFDYAKPSSLENAHEGLSGFCKEHGVNLSKSQIDQIKTARNVAEFSVPGKKVKDMEFGKAFMLGGGHDSWVGRLKI